MYSRITLLFIKSVVVEQRNITYGLADTRRNNNVIFRRNDIATSCVRWANVRVASLRLVRQGRGSIFLMAVVRCRLFRSPNLCVYSKNSVSIDTIDTFYFHFINTK